jgi:tRNA G18 (ribose-2'-O)-methylase SpoU
MADDDTTHVRIGMPRSTLADLLNKPTKPNLSDIVAALFDAAHRKPLESLLAVLTVLLAAFLLIEAFLIALGLADPPNLGSVIATADLALGLVLLRGVCDQLRRVL